MKSIRRAIYTISVRTMLLFLIGGAIQVGPTFVLLFDLFSLTVQQLSTLETVILSAGVFTIGVAYCVFASVAFTPKRLFTPTFLQFATWCYLSPVLLAIGLVESSPFRIPLENILIQWIQNVVVYVTGFLLVLAIGQFFVVRFFVGRNGTKDDIVQAGFEVALPFKDVIEKIMKVGKHPYLVWQRHHDRGTHHVFKLWVNGSNYILLVMAPDLKDEKRTLVALANFNLYWTTIAKSQFAEEAIDTVKSHLLKLLSCNELPLSDDRIMRISAEEALESTRPRTLSWGTRIDKDVQRLFGALTVLIFGMIILWTLKILPDNIFYEFIVFLTLDMVFVGVPAISEKIGNVRSKVAVAQPTVGRPS